MAPEMLFKQNLPICSKEVRVLSISLGCVGPGHNSSLCLCFIGIDSKTFIVLDTLPCGLQYFLAFVIQTGFPSRWSKCCCQILLPLMHFVHTSSGENIFIGFPVSKIVFVLSWFYTALLLPLLNLCFSYAALLPFIFFMFCLGGLGFFLH